MPQDVAAAIADASGNRVSVKAPEKPGVYCLYGWIKEG
jgi:hypothetical protein